MAVYKNGSFVKPSNADNKTASLQDYIIMTSSYCGVVAIIPLLSLDKEDLKENTWSCDEIWI